MYPALFNYRHSVEIYLKSVLLSEIKVHSIKKLVDNLEAELKANHGVVLPPQIKSACMEFYEFDKTSTTFRYDDNIIKSDFTGDIGEFWIDYNLLKRK